MDSIYLLIVATSKETITVHIWVLVNKSNKVPLLSELLAACAHPSECLIRTISQGAIVLGSISVSSDYNHL